MTLTDYPVVSGRLRAADASIEHCVMALLDISKVIGDPDFADDIVKLRDTYGVSRSMIDAKLRAALVPDHVETATPAPLAPAPPPPPVESAKMVKFPEAPDIFSDAYVEDRLAKTKAPAPEEDEDPFARAITPHRSPNPPPVPGVPQLNVARPAADPPPKPVVLASPDERRDIVKAVRAKGIGLFQFRQALSATFRVATTADLPAADVPDVHEMIRRLPPDGGSE